MKSEPRQGFALSTRKGKSHAAQCEFCKPGFQNYCSSGPERHKPLLPPLSAEVYLSLGTETELILPKSDNLRYTRAGVVHRQQQSVISSPQPLFLIENG